jgi:hypothetical protein
MSRRKRTRQAKVALELGFLPAKILFVILGAFAKGTSKGYKNHLRMRKSSTY